MYTVYIVIKDPTDGEKVPNSYVSETIPCSNGENAASGLRCLLSFDGFGEIIGCRDMSHLQSCGMIHIICFHILNNFVLVCILNALLNVCMHPLEISLAANAVKLLFELTFVFSN